jgi:hypothetical protein
VEGSVDIAMTSGFAGWDAAPSMQSAPTIRRETVLNILVSMLYLRLVNRIQ